MRVSKKAQAVMAKFAKAAGTPKKTIASKVATLTKQVKKLNTVSYDNVTTVSAVAQNQNLTTAYNAYNLSRLNPVALYAIPVFGHTSADLVDVNKAYLNSKDVFVSIRQNNEPNLVRMSMFLVSLKDQGATTTLVDPASRQLLLTGGTEFTSAGTGPENTILNPGQFTIHATRRFTMGYEGSAGPMADTHAQRRFKFTIKPKQKLIENPVGNMFANASFPSPTDWSQNYFIIIFNDNSAVDLEEPKVDIAVYDHWAIPS